MKTPIKTQSKNSGRIRYMLLDAVTLLMIIAIIVGSLTLLETTTALMLRP